MTSNGRAHSSRIRAAIAGLAWGLGSSIGAPGAAAAQVYVAFTLPTRDLVPEGLAYDGTSKSFFVSSTYRRQVVRVDSLGRHSVFGQGARDGLWGVVGMDVDAARRMLWVASSHAGDGMPMIDMDSLEEGRSGLFQYDIETGRLLARYLLVPPPDGEGHFLNDLTILPSGDVFVTDSRARVVYRLAVGAPDLEVFVGFGERGSPNGIVHGPDRGSLYVALGQDVVRVDLATREVHPVPRPSQGRGLIDGLYYDRESLIAVQPFTPGFAVVRLALNTRRDTVTRVDALVPTHPALNQPTTGAVVDTSFYFIANSQLQRFRRLFAAGEPLDTLAAPIVLRVSLP